MATTSKQLSYIRDSSNNDGNIKTYNAHILVLLNYRYNRNCSAQIVTDANSFYCDQNVVGDNDQFRQRNVINYKVFYGFHIVIVFMDFLFGTSVPLLRLSLSLSLRRRGHSVYGYFHYV